MAALLALTSQIFEISALLVMHYQCSIAKNVVTTAKNVQLLQTSVRNVFRDINSVDRSVKNVLRNVMSARYLLMYVPDVSVDIIL